MRIALISYWSCPLTRVGILNAGGMSIYILNLVNTLADQGHEIDIYTKSHKIEKHAILTLHNSVRVIHLKSKITDPSSQRQYRQFIPHYSKMLIDFINKNNLNYDIFYSHYYLSGLIGIDLKNYFHKPLAQTFHTLSRIKEVYTGKIDRKREKDEQNVIRFANAIIASTLIEKQDLITKYKAPVAKIYVIPPGVNHNQFKKHDKKKYREKLDLPQNKKIILFVGRIDPLKGIKSIIEATYFLTKRYPSFENNFQVLLIGGDIESRHFWQNIEVKKIKQLIMEKKLECCIKFIGSQPHHLLPYYYSAADIVVMPSEYESFGFVTLEAMACGSAVIASKVGGLKYLIKDRFNGRLFESGNNKQFANVIWELVNDKKEQERLGKNAQGSSQRFCWEKQAKKMTDVFKKLI